MHDYLAHGATEEDIIAQTIKTDRPGDDGRRVGGRDAVDADAEKAVAGE